MKIKFIESVTIPASRNQKELRFKDGSVHDLSDASAWRWVRRNKAVYYIEEKAAPKLKVGRPMMGGSMEKAVSSAILAAPDKPKKVGRPKKRA